MAYSRLGKAEEKRALQRLALSLGGTLALIVIVVVFGVKILQSFSLFVEKLSPAPPKTTEEAQLILPPILNPLPEATFSAQLDIRGSGQPNTTAILYLNDNEVKRSPIGADGSFRFDAIGFPEGTNTVYAKITDGKKSTSKASQTLEVKIKKTLPKLEITTPTEDQRVNGDSRTIIVTGVTDPDGSVTVNDRIAIVDKNGSFSFSMQLADGDNTIKVVAIDQAGNKTTIERHATYNQ